MEIYFLRHGEAGKRVPIASRDTERALTASGRKEVEEVGEGMAELGLKFDVVATSPLKRAKETASIVNKALNRKHPVEEWSELAPDGNRNALYDRLRKLRLGSTVMFVGHEPYLTTSIGEIVGRDGVGSSSPRIVLKKGGLAKVSVTGVNPRVMGELRWLLTPKQIRKMA
jgi:phosphohistidine phosphatase